MKIKFSYLILFIALFIAGCAGYFSVWGLSQLFAGASTAVIIMATILEIGKIVTTTALHRYWNKITLGLKTYLTISVVVLMIITSAGIYGFLSNAYQKTANKLELQQNEVSLLTDKSASFDKKIKNNEVIIVTKSKRIDQLTNLRTTQESRMDLAVKNVTKDKVRKDINLATNEIQKLSSEIDELNTKNSVLSDSVASYSTKKLNLKSKSEVTSEVGPLKYISELTNQPMAKVVNFLMLLLIFVFDPLAIALILLTNKIFELDSQEQQTSIASVIENVEINEPESEIEPEPIIEEVIEEVKPEPVIYKKTPVIPNGKVELADIKEVKEAKDRGYSVNVPQPKNSNAIERIGSNKIVKNGDNNKVFFKRDK